MFIIGNLGNYGVDGATNYDWDLPAGFSFMSSYCPNNSNCETQKIWTSAQPGTYTIKVYPFNTCGSSGTGYQSIQVHIPGGEEPDPTCPDPPCMVPHPIRLAPVNDPKENKPARIAIYPNPAFDELTIEPANLDEEGYSLTVLSTAGTEIYSYQGHNELHQINLANLKPGMYFVNVLYHDRDGKLQKYQNSIIKN